MEVVGVAAPPFLPPSPSFATVAKGDTQWNGSHSDRCGGLIPSSVRVLVYVRIEAWRHQGIRSRGNGKAYSAKMYGGNKVFVSVNGSWFFLFRKSRSLQCCKYCCGLQESARPPPKKGTEESGKSPESPLFHRHFPPRRSRNLLSPRWKGPLVPLLTWYTVLSLFFFSLPPSPHFPALLFFIIALAPALRRNGGRRTRKSKERKTEVDLPSFLPFSVS